MLSDDQIDEITDTLKTLLQDANQPPDSFEARMSMWYFGERLLFLAANFGAPYVDRVTIEEDGPWLEGEAAAIDNGTAEFSEYLANWSRLMSAAGSTPEANWDSFLDDQAIISPRIRELLEQSRTTPVSAFTDEVEQLLRLANALSPEWPGRAPKRRWKWSYTVPPSSYLESLAPERKQAYEDWERRRRCMDYLEYNLAGGLEMGDPPGDFGSCPVRMGTLCACSGLPLEPMVALLGVCRSSYEQYVEEWEDRPEDWDEFDHPITPISSRVTGVTTIRVP